VIWRTARLVAAKDLRIEWRSKVAIAQVLPFAVVTLTLFAFALNGADSALLRSATPGLYWVTILLILVLASQRAFVVETDDGALDALRLSGLPPAGIFLGKAWALAVQLWLLEAVLALGVIVLYNPTGKLGGTDPVFSWTVERAVLLVIAGLAATPGLAAVGTLHGALAAGSRARDTLLPLLVLPIVVPALLGGVRTFEAVLALNKRSASEGWPWVGLLLGFSLVAVVVGTLAFGPLIEEDPS
jgi:heme exporter protein B